MSCRITLLGSQSNPFILLASAFNWSVSSGDEPITAWWVDTWTGSWCGLNLDGLDMFSSASANIPLSFIASGLVWIVVFGSWMGNEEWWKINELEFRDCFHSWKGCVMAWDWFCSIIESYKISGQFAKKAPKILTVIRTPSAKSYLVQNSKKVG